MPHDKLLANMTRKAAEFSIYNGGSWRYYRPRTYYYAGNWFSWNVKLHNLDLSLENLLRRYKAITQDSLTRDPAWFTAAEQLWRRLGYDENSEELYTQSILLAKQDFPTDINPDGDAYYGQLQSGKPVDALFEFQGRQGGWVSLVRFQQINLTDYGGFNFNAWSFANMRLLYLYLKQVDSRIGCGRHKVEIETQAAVLFFNRYLLASDSTGIAQLEHKRRLQRQALRFDLLSRKRPVSIYAQNDATAKTDSPQLRRFIDIPRKSDAKIQETYSLRLGL